MQKRIAKTLTVVGAIDFVELLIQTAEKASKANSKKDYETLYQLGLEINTEIDRVFGKHIAKSLFADSSPFMPDEKGGIYIYDGLRTLIPYVKSVLVEQRNKIDEIIRFFDEDFKV